MATIRFRGKARTARYPDNSVAWQFIQVPQLGTRHCDMAEFRTHPKYGGLANSDLFPGVLRKLRDLLFPSGYVRLDQIPDCVTIDTTGYLAEVEVTV